MKRISSVGALLLVGSLSTGCMVESAVPDAIEHERRTFDLLGPIAGAHPDARCATVEQMSAIRAKAARPQAPDVIGTWAAYSRAELADKLRVVLASRNNHLYIERQPNIEAADALLSGQSEQQDVWPFLSTARDRRVFPGAIAQSREAAIFGGDDRRMPASTSSVPNHAVARITSISPNTTASCSAFYIGNWTLLTAAHCLVHSDTDRANRLIIEPARDGSNLPFGSFDCRLDDANTLNDYLWAVPQGFLTGRNFDFDYAVIDTWPCHRAPQSFPAYQVNGGDTGYFTYGYPDQCPGAPAPEVHQCGMEGFAYVNGAWLESQDIDTSQGQSGAPLYNTMHGLQRPAAILSHYTEWYDLFRCGFDRCRRNRFRRIDMSVSEFIRATSFDF